MDIDKDKILNEVGLVVKDLIHYSENAQSELFLRCYLASPDFVAVSADGMIRNYQDFSQVCKDYYASLKEQKSSTIHEIYHVVDEITVVFCWSGNIDAFFKNGDFWKMQQYTVTYLFRKIDKEWKIIHTHESALPVQMVKSR